MCVYFNSNMIDLRVHQLVQCGNEPKTYYNCISHTCTNTHTRRFTRAHRRVHFSESVCEREAFSHICTLLKRIRMSWACMLRICKNCKESNWNRAIACTSSALAFSISTISQSTLLTLQCHSYTHTHIYLYLHKFFCSK